MIRHLTARKIASAWYGGQWTGLYALSSSGAIIVNREFGTQPETVRDAQGDLVLVNDPDTLATLTALDEITNCLQSETTSIRDRNDLMNLFAYVNYYGPRGPVDGWAKLSW